MNPHAVALGSVTLRTAGISPRLLALTAAELHERGFTVAFAPPLGDELYGRVMEAAAKLMALPAEAWMPEREAEPHEEAPDAAD